MSERLTLTVVEISSLFIIAGFLVVMGRGFLFAGGKDGRARPMKSIAVDIVLIAAASWVAEVSCIRLYAFYQYDAPWLLYADVMPVLVVAIWPFVILSARELAFRFGFERSAIAVFAFVLYDAALVEPVAVKAGLWSWNHPGLFGAPLIGILGWAYFSVLHPALSRAARGATTNRGW